MAQDNDKKLYKIANRLGTFYIVAKTFDGAADTLRQRLDQADYGFFQYRDIPAIEHVATQSFHYDGIKQSFESNKPNLLIAGDTSDADSRHFAEQMAAKCEECEKLKHDYDQISAELADANEHLQRMQDGAVKMEEASKQYLAVVEKANSTLSNENCRLKEEIASLTSMPAPAPADESESNQPADSEQEESHGEVQPAENMPEEAPDNYQSSNEYPSAVRKRKFRIGDTIQKKNDSMADTLVITDINDNFYICNDGAEPVPIICQSQYKLIARPRP